ncbi:hypothetical protein B0H11DRAFT_2215563 [Mycena galericulata]|nr:hypothetical protein B0H11DRAFT_2215563 [Mycena galericulata]
MPTLSRFDALHSWWSDSCPPGATISIHAVAKPLMRYLHHRQAREFVRKNQRVALSREALEIFTSYLTYVAHGTKALVLKELAARSDSEAHSDAPVIMNALSGKDGTFSELLRSPNTEVKNWAYELLINLARNKSAWKSCLPWTPCTPFVDLLRDRFSGHVSPPAGLRATDQKYQLHIQAEQVLEEAKVKMVPQVKVLLLDPDDSGKSTLLEQMWFVYGMPSSPHEKLIPIASSSFST